MKQRTAAIYCRVSTTGQAQDGTSLTTQLEACRAYATAQGLTVLKGVQEDISGALVYRPGLDAIRDLARARKLSAIICYDPDRLSRNAALLLTLAREWNDAGIDLLFVNVHFDNNPEGELNLGMRGVFAQYERAKIAERTQRGKKQRAREGKLASGGYAPYGYQILTDTQQLAISEPEAAVVRLIFDWVGREGLSLGKVAARLTERGVPTYRGGKQWYSRTLQNIIRSEVYIGTLHYNKAKQPKGSTTRIPRDRSEWIGIPAPALITQAEYDAAQATLARNKKLSLRNCKREYLMRGLMVCGVCGLSMTSHSKRDRPRYSCMGRHTDHIAAGLPRCTGPTFQAEALEQAVWDAVAGWLADRDRLMAVLDGLEGADDSERKRLEADLVALNGVLLDLDEQENALIELYTKQKISMAKFEDRSALLDHQRAGLLQTRGEMETRLAEQETIQANRDALAELSALASEGLRHLTFDEKRRVLTTLRVRVRCNADRSLTLSGLITEQLLAPGVLRKARERAVYATCPMRVPFSLTLPCWKVAVVA